MEYHPLSNIFPLIDGAEFEKLIADIQNDGLQLAISTYQGKILDGRNRERACNQIGVEPRYEDSGATDNDSALKLVIARKTLPRHGGLAWQAFAAVELSKLISIPLEKASSLVGVSYPSASRARKIQKHGTETDIKNAMSGKVALDALADALGPQRPQKAKKVKIISISTAPSIKSRTREEIDPDWAGDEMEWVRRHGHTTSLTAVQRASVLFNNATEELRAAVHKIKKMQPQTPRQVIDDYWLKKLIRPSQRDIIRMREALEYLRPRIAEAEAALARASEPVVPKDEIESADEIVVMYHE